MNLEKLHFKEAEKNALKLVHTSNNRFLWLKEQIPWLGYLSISISD